MPIAVPSTNVSGPFSRLNIEGSLTTGTSTTTADGDAGGNYIVDASLIGSPDYFTAPIPKTIQILPPQQGYWKESAVVAFDNTTGKITVSPAYGVQIKAGTGYRALNTPGGSGGGGGGSAVPKLYVGDLVVSVDTVDANDVVITGSLTVNAGVAYATNGTLQVKGDINLQANSMLSSLDLTYGGNFNAAVDGVVVVTVGDQIGSGAFTLGGGTSGNVTVSGIFTTGVFTDAIGSGLVAGSGNIINGNYNENGFSIFNGPLTINQSLEIANGGTMNVTGALTVSGGGIDSGDGCTLFTRGKTYVNGDLTNTTGYMEIFGNLEGCGAINQTGLGGLINIYGNTQIAADLTNSGTGAINITGNTQVGTHVVNTGGGTITTAGKFDINGDSSGAGEGYFDNTGGGNVLIGGDMFTTGYVTNDTAHFFILGGLRTAYSSVTNGAGVMIIDGYCYSFGNILNNGAFDIYGNTTVSSGGIINKGIFNCTNLSCTGFDGIGGISFTAYGDVLVTGDWINDTCNSVIYGVARIYGDITTSTGTLTYHGVYPESEVNTTAVLGTPTDIINLAQIAGFHYYVDKLRLKFNDPGIGNDVIVSLWENIDGTPTVTDTFTVTTAGTNPYTSYYSLMDMFGLQMLAGDFLEVTVQQEVAGGPTVCAGSFSSRSA
jgi:hypothetical protein